ncbi:PREDICTED: uncharacterized protein LOC106107901 [Papilio polytes]|uniref:uncharacterized protein LOC106107901 n=1 Tax=Papilio polytes TaxID=76194 RepID=UPI000675F969|nr:PREDICTED: uncharacterized protein LOC106107901 [Papilio polytes]
MENSINEHEVQQSIRSPPRRRRSTFFERRDSLGPQLLSGRTEENVTKTDADINENHKQELQSYYEQLLSEKEQWKKEVNNRKNRYHDLRLQYQLAVKASSKAKICYSALTNEDIEFLKGKVNITKLVDSQTKLHKSVRESHALFKRAAELDNVILSHCENRIKQINEYILDNSSIEPKT